jgi:hypothetical protein
VISVLIEVNVTVENVEEANDIAEHLHETLNRNGITNSVNATDEISS